MNKENLNLNFKGILNILVPGLLILSILLLFTFPYENIFDTLFSFFTGIYIFTLIVIIITIFLFNNKKYNKITFGNFMKRILFSSIFFILPIFIHDYLLQSNIPRNCGHYGCFDGIAEMIYSVFSLGYILVFNIVYVSLFNYKVKVFLSIKNFFNKNLKILFALLVLIWIVIVFDYNTKGLYIGISSDSSKKEYIVENTFNEKYNKCNKEDIFSKKVCYINLMKYLYVGDNQYYDSLIDKHKVSEIFGFIIPKEGLYYSKSCNRKIYINSSDTEYSIQLVDKNIKDSDSGINGYGYYYDKLGGNHNKEISLYKDFNKERFEFNLGGYTNRPFIKFTDISTSNDSFILNNRIISYKNGTLINLFEGCGEGEIKFHKIINDNNFKVINVGNSNNMILFSEKKDSMNYSKMEIISNGIVNEINLIDAEINGKVEISGDNIIYKTIYKNSESNITEKCYYIDFNNENTLKEEVDAVRLCDFSPRYYDLFDGKSFKCSSCEDYYCRKEKGCFMDIINKEKKSFDEDYIKCNIGKGIDKKDCYINLLKYLELDNPYTGIGFDKEKTNEIYKYLKPISGTYYSKKCDKKVTISSNQNKYLIDITSEKSKKYKLIDYLYQKQMNIFPYKYMNDYTKDEEMPFIKFKDINKANNSFIINNKIVNYEDGITKNLFEGCDEGQIEFKG